MSVAPRVDGAARALPALPSVARTRDDQELAPADAVWSSSMRKEGGTRFHLNWNKLEGLSPRMIHIAKVLLATRMIGYAPATTRNDFDALRRLGRWHRQRGVDGQRALEWSDISDEFARAFLDHGVENTAQAGNDFARLRDLYRHGLELALSDEFTPKTLMSMEVLRAPGNAKGNAVHQGDPEQGYFTPPEIDLILDAIGGELGTPEQRALVWLCLEIGRNTTQYVLLTNGDLRFVEASSPEGRSKRLYHVHVRRMKKRTVSDQKLAWPVSEALGDLLWSLRRGGDSEPLLWWIQGESGFDATLSMHEWAEAAGLVSPRTGETMRLNARRFRVTLLTNAGDEGASPEHLAVLADHTDLQNVQVYLDRSPNFLLRIRDKVDEIYSPLVSRFKGRISERDRGDNHATHAHHEIPGSAAHLPLLDVGGIGACGSKKICKLAPPLSCYTCENFIAFRDGPHAQVVVALERSMRQMGDRIALQIAGPLAAAREVVALVAAEQTEAP